MHMASRRRAPPIKQISAAAVAAGQDPNQLFTTGAIMRGRSLYYIGRILGPRLHIKASSVAHTIRGYRRGCPPTRRLTREEYEGIFDGSQPFRRGEIQVTEIPGLDEDTADFSLFHWVAPQCGPAHSVGGGGPVLPVTCEAMDGGEEGAFDMDRVYETDGSIWEREGGCARDDGRIEWPDFALE
jgi:hypothetical protein